jgi:uncharacterized membrane protein
MKRKTFLIPFLAVFVLLTFGIVSAGNLATGVETEFNGVELGSGTTMAGMVGDMVPVKVTFEADQDMGDVRVNVRIEGHRDDVDESTSRFDIVDGSTYTKLLNLRLPSDLKDLTKEFTLYVEISSSSDRTEEPYTIKMQRESYTLDVLSVDYSTQVSAGDVVPVVVVLKNEGFNRADDNYVVASIADLGVSSRGYAGDLVSSEYCDEDVNDFDCEDEEDSVQKTLYLKVPEGAASGVYELEVRAYNSDTETVVRKLINVGAGSSTMVVAAVKNQDMKAGETTIYDLILVNSAKNVKVYNLQSVSGSDLTVSVPSVVTVSPDSSKTVQVAVTASNDAPVGTYTFSVDVDGEAVVFGANVTEGGATSASVVALTVILVIIFVVLLAVLVVLLTRKEQPIEEVETSYY